MSDLKVCLPVLFFILTSFKSFSQLDNSALFFNTTPDTAEKNTAFLKFQNLNFMKDNEYSGPMTDGYTLFGYQLNAQAGFKISRELSIEGGIFLRRDFGNNNFVAVLPTFSLRYHKNDFKMIVGNLDGSLNHQLIEPLYNFERVMTNRLENGAQFILTKKRFDLDAWVDWLNMMYRYSSFKERFMAGANITLFKFKSEAWELKVPVQCVMIHSGGQLDTLAFGDSTNFSGAAGVVVQRNFQSKYFKSVYADVRYVRGNRSYSYRTILKESWGDGVLANIGIKGAYHTDLQFSYWYGNNYDSDLGGYLYQSQSSNIVYSYYRQRLRELLIMRISKKISLAEKVNLLLRAEPYYDMRFGWFEIAYGFYVSFDERIWLKKRKAAPTN
jgi:hypothetical protein